MKYIVIVFGLIPIFLVGVGFLKPELIFGSQPLSASMIWSLIGTFISYLGFIFSFFALLAVKELSTRYFTKQRLPDIKKQLVKITSSMGELADSELTDIKSARFFSQTAVVLRQLKKIKGTDFSSVVKRAESSHTRLEKTFKRNPNSVRELANDSPEYWDLYRALSELTDEIDAYNKGVQASL